MKIGRSYSPFEHLAQAVLLSRWKQGYWFMGTIGTTAYFDDSCLDASHNIGLVAGFIATTDMWCHLEKKWSQLMSKKPPRLKWKNYVQRNCLYFAHLAKTYTLKAVGFSLPNREYKPIFDLWQAAVMPHARNLHRYIPYLMSEAGAFCSFMCCEQLDTWAHERKLRKSLHPIKVVFDKGSEFQHSLEKGYEAYYSSKKTYLLSTPIFDSDEDVLPLQAAHLFAWLLSRSNNQALSGESPESKALNIIREGNHSTI